MKKGKSQINLLQTLWEVCPNKRTTGQEDAIESDAKEKKGDELTVRKTRPSRKEGNV